jgi:hypothetical protein
MAKPTKVRYSGVGVYANQFLLSRVQSLSVDTDTSEEEVRELTNPEVVEFIAQTPAVSISIETNEYGSCRNLRAITSVTGADNITVSSFDGSSVDICVMVEEDNVLKRTLVMNDCFLSSISWNFDVGGVATERFDFETDNKTWYVNDYKQAYSYMGIGELTITSCYIDLDWNTFTGEYIIAKQYVNGIEVTGSIFRASGVGVYANYSKIYWNPQSQIGSGLTRYRTVIIKTGADTTIPESPSTSPIGGITRGMIDIYLVTGGANFGTEGETNFLRLQTCSIDVDFSREVLNELGHFRAYDRSLTYPVPVTVTFSANASDLEEWAKFQTKDWSDTMISSLGIDSFTKTAALQIRIFDARDTEATRNLKKVITISGLQVTTESFGVDQGGNATQEYTAKASNFLVTGVGIPSDYTS